MSVLELIERVAHAWRPRQAPDGAMPSGHNGPYRDPETRVRNTAHWLITWSFLADRGGDRRWRDAAARAAAYLADPARRPGGFTYHHRDAPGKDRCNGLIGQAWVIEALAEAHRLWGGDRWSRLGEEVFFLHDFDEPRGLWRITEVDGTRRGFDATFNHQLWFAAAAARLRGARQAEVRARVACFLDRCLANVEIFGSGLIYHPIPARRVVASRWRRAARTARDALSRAGPLRRLVPRAADFRAMVSKSAGYHAFNTYAFTLLRREFPDHMLWRAAPLRRTIDYLLSDEYRAAVRWSRYGFPYNAPGFEVPVSLELATDLAPTSRRRLARDWLEAQIAATWDGNARAFARGTPDPVTLTARVYELTRLPDEELAGLRVAIPAARTRGADTAPARPGS